MKAVTKFLAVILGLSGCGQNNDLPVRANMEIPNKTVSFTSVEKVICESNGSEPEIGVKVRVSAVKVEFRKKTGEFFSINLPEARVDSDKRQAVAVTQGAIASSVAWGGPTGSYSTASATALPADATQVCSVTINYNESGYRSYSIDSFEVTCTNITGIKSDKSNMHLSGRCSY